MLCVGRFDAVVEVAVRRMSLAVPMAPAVQMVEEHASTLAVPVFEVGLLLLLYLLLLSLRS